VHAKRVKKALQIRAHRSGGCLWRPHRSAHAPILDSAARESLLVDAAHLPGHRHVRYPAVDHPGLRELRKLEHGGVDDVKCRLPQGKEQRARAWSSRS
jgi:hypothetical protein